VAGGADGEKVVTVIGSALRAAQDVVEMLTAARTGLCGGFAPRTVQM